MVIKYISDKKVRSSYSMCEIVDAVERAYKGYSKGEIIIPQRIFTKTENGGDYLYGAATNLKSKGFIILGSAYMPWNKKKNIPMIKGYYMYMDYKTGQLLSVIDGTSLVDLRTGAKSAVAARYLARSNSKVLGIIGLGTQAKTQAEAIATQFKLERILAWTRNPKTKKEHLKYIKNKTKLDVEFRSKDNVIKESDILVVATGSEKPLVRYKDLHQGQLIISLSHSLEVDPDLAKSCKCYVDLLDTMKNEGGPVKEALDKRQVKLSAIHDLAEVIGGKAQARVDEKEIIYFQSLGVMHENLAVVEYIYKKIIRKIRKLK